MAEVLGKNLFASKVLLITVGPDNAQFNIHQALLQQRTSFFDVHPTRNGGKIVTTQKLASEADETIKNEGSPATESGFPTMATISDARSASDNGGDPSASETTLNADYHVDTRFVKAFAICVDWLYNTAPKAPKSLMQCKVLIQAYLLAQDYHATGLQNLLVDSIRGYHIGHTVEFDALFIYLLNRCKDNTDCNLVRYFVDQIAYEIADTSVEDYRTTNGGFDNFLSDRPSCQVRKALFYEMSRIARAAMSGQTVMDPAKMDGSECGYYTQ